VKEEKDVKDGMRGGGNVREVRKGGRESEGTRRKECASSAKEGRKEGRKVKTDQSQLSLTLALNGEDEYEGSETEREGRKEGT
jgi:hypothetical protein